MKIPGWISFLGIPAFAWILYTLDLTKLLDSLQSINLSYLIFVILIFFPIILLKTLRWSAILKMRSIALPLSGLYSAYMSSFSAGGVTPGRFGEMLKFSYVEDAGYGFGVSLSSAFSDRLWDALFLLFIGLIGLPFIYPLSSGQIAVNTAVIAVSILSIIVFTMYRSSVYRFLSKLISKLIPEKYRKKLEGEGNKFFQTLLPKSLNEFFTLLSATFLSWLIYFFRFFVLAIALGISIDFISLSLILSITALLTLLPITVSGVGTRDAALIVLLKPFGINSELAVALSLSMLAIFMVDIFIGYAFGIAFGAKQKVNELNGN